MKQPISLERYRQGVSQVFDLLRSNSDGMNSYEIAKMTGLPRSTVYIILQDNPLFYVDRCRPARSGGYTQVWCAAEFERHEHCPQPEEDMSKGSGRRPTNEAAFQSNYDLIFRTKKVLELQDELSAASFGNDYEAEEPSGVGSVDDGQRQAGSQDQAAAEGMDA
jgi:hypothetical protein